jgi:hypothetical protein
MEMSMTFEKWWDGFSEKEEFKNYKWIAEIGWCAGQSEIRNENDELKKRIAELEDTIRIEFGEPEEYDEHGNPKG